MSIDKRQDKAMSARAAVLLARYEEEKARDAGKPYSEAVIATCDLFLQGTHRELRKMHIELGQPKEN